MSVCGLRFLMILLVSRKNDKVEFDGVGKMSC